MRRRTIVLLTLAALASCRTGRDFPDPHGPRYAGAAPLHLPAPVQGTLRIVSFNIAYAREIERAIQIFRSEPALQNADIVLLQEMDASGTARLARALGMGYVYYPAIFHLRAKKEIGNTVLSRWPIVDDSKIQLPYGSRYAGTHRTATAATLRVGDALVRVYSTHLGTAADIGPMARRGQLLAILADAARFEKVVIGGDMNSDVVGSVATGSRYEWPTRYGPRTTRFGRWDHIYVKGFATPDSGATGTVMNQRGSSDHRPVWVRVRLIRRT